MKKWAGWKGQRHMLLSIADTLLSTFVFFPLTVLHWEGTWVLQDAYFIPADNGASTLLSLAIGAIVCTVQLLVQPQLAECLLRQPPVLYFVITRLHLYIHGWAILCYWRGVWNLLDLLFNSDHPSFCYIVIGIYLVCQLLMVLFRTVRTTIGPPVSIKLDFCDDLLETDLIFKVHHSSPLWFTLDCLFTQFVIVTTSLTIWWALWGLYDQVLFTTASSDPLCLFIGFIISISFLLLEAPLAWVSQQLDESFWWKVAYEDAIFIALTWANLMFWRGFWNVWVKDFLDHKWVGVWFSHVIGTLGLLVLQSLNTTGQHGIDRDGSYEGGSGIFPNKFLTIIFHKQLAEDVQYERVQTGGDAVVDEAEQQPLNNYNNINNHKNKNHNNINNNNNNINTNKHLKSSVHINSTSPSTSTTADMHAAMNDHDLHTKSIKNAAYEGDDDVDDGYDNDENTSIKGTPTTPLVFKAAKENKSSTIISTNENKEGD